ncbi:MAG: hypothetical protein WAM11_08405 [Cyanobium sp.]
MAEPADQSHLTEQYAAIEKAYCADQWGDVIDQGRNLLQEIPHSSGSVPEGLKERVQLLMAHAHLYGFNERDAAEDLYGAVLHSQAEIALRQIAEQGLQQCGAPRQVTAAQAEPDGNTGPSPGPGVAAASDVVSAPDSPARAQAATGTEPAPSGSEPAAKSGSGASGSAAAAPATANAAAATPATLNPPGADAAATSSLAMPWLVAGDALAGGGASPETPSAPTPWATATTPRATAATTPAPAAPLEPVPPQPPAAAGEAVSPAQERSVQETTLIPEVVEEPELLEVHQADPTLAEELELTLLEPELTDDGSASLRTASPLASAAILATPATDAAAMERPEETLAQQQPQAIQQRLEEAESIPWQQRQPAPGEAQNPLPLSRDAGGLSEGMEPICELFRHPPASVEAEDQDLLLGLGLGLLRVLVSAGSAGDGG